MIHVHPVLQHIIALGLIIALLAATTTTLFLFVTAFLIKKSSWVLTAGLACVGLVCLLLLCVVLRTALTFDTELVMYQIGIWFSVGVVLFLIGYAKNGELRSIKASMREVLPAACIRGWLGPIELIPLLTRFKF